MTDPVLHDQLKALFTQAGQAHHQAFIETDGEDPDWPIWYAQHLKQPLEDLVGRKFVLSRMIYCLMDADDEHQALAPDEDWADYYARHFVECFAASEEPAEDKLALYYSPTCPFCRRVMKVIDRLGVDVELRHVYAEPKYRDELIEARGRGTVPVLWIQSPDGSVRWMPESLDIIDYLQRMYGAQKAA